MQLTECHEQKDQDCVLGTYLTVLLDNFRDPDYYPCRRQKSGREFARLRLDHPNLVRGSREVVSHTRCLTSVDSL